MKTCPRCKSVYPDEKSECFVDGSKLTEETTLIGTTIHGRYVIESLLGRGGMASVYAARHALVDKRYALKWVSRYDARSSVIRERFKREARAMKRLEHPNIVAIFDDPRETDDGDIYIVMELLEGGTLAQIIGRGPIPIKRALGLAIQTARGIARAHDLDVIHRDLKPENIFVVRGPKETDLVKLLDFGIARSLQDPRLSATGELFGTPQYMAPERLDADGGDGAPADLYAFGVILYEMLTGFLPFEAEDFSKLFMKHLNEAPKPPSRYLALPPRLEALVMALLAKKPKERPVDAHRVRQELTEISIELGFPPPEEPTTTGPTLAPAEISKASQPLLWRKQIEIFTRMVQAAFGDDPPWRFRMYLSELGVREKRIGTLRAEGAQAQAQLEILDKESRERRVQMGRAVDQLGSEVSRARTDARSRQEERAKRIEAGRDAKRAYLAAQRDVTYWEGRSAFHAPYAELAEAYEKAAATMRVWLAAHAEEREAERLVAAADSVVNDVEFQIRELRTNLSNHEAAMDKEREACERRVTATTLEAAGLEHDLANLASSFCGQLRGRTELRSLFTELEGVVVSPPDGGDPEASRATIAAMSPLVTS